jgi:hypothetical protein
LRDADDGFWDSIARRGRDHRRAVLAGTGAGSGRLHAIAIEAREKSKKVVRLRTIRERGLDDEDLGEDNPARPALLVDQLQRAAHLGASTEAPIWPPIERDSARRAGWRCAPSAKLSPTAFQTATTTGV